ncbi:listerin E3 ubiquitin protein ligase 1 [Blyttiomyces sp. JEL0837]|nr:listerin E3 ubiquitin protein ligase 1 [Blyttiomyces sp. JEL0837]
MGKEKGNRVKGNLQPADSSRAADLLTSFGAASGFSDFSTFSATPIATSQFFDESLDISGDLKIILKRLAKKDNVTRQKASDDLAAHMKSMNADDMRNFLPAWPKILGRLGIDADRKIRENTFACHSILVQNLKKELAPLLKEIIGVWLCAHYDASKEVVRLAQESFQVIALSAFSNKRVDVLSFCNKSILEFVADNLFQQTPETLSDARYTSEEDMQAKYHRLLASSVMVLDMLYKSLPADKLEASSSEFANIFENPKFWELLRSPSAQTRLAMYTLINTLSTEERTSAQKCISFIESTFFDAAFGDEEASIHGQMVTTLLTFSKRFPSSWLSESGSSKKSKGPVKGLMKFLRKGAYGSARFTYPAMLPLISVLPDELIMSKEASFVSLFFESLWQGLSYEYIDRPSTFALVSAYYECVRYLISKQKRIKGDVRGNFSTEFVTSLDKLITSVLSSGIGFNEKQLSEADKAVFYRQTGLFISRLNTECAERKMGALKTLIADKSLSYFSLALTDAIRTPSPVIDLIWAISKSLGPEITSSHERRALIKEFIMNSFGTWTASKFSKDTCETIVEWLRFMSAQDSDINVLCEKIASDLIAGDTLTLLTMLQLARQISPLLPIVTDSMEVFVNALANDPTKRDEHTLKVLAIYMTLDLGDSRRRGQSSVFHCLGKQLHESTAKVYEDTNGLHSDEIRSCLSLLRLIKEAVEHSPQVWNLSKELAQQVFFDIASLAVFDEEFLHEVTVATLAIWPLVSASFVAHCDVESLYSLYKAAILNTNHLGSPSEYSTLFITLFNKFPDPAASMSILRDALNLLSRDIDNLLLGRERQVVESTNLLIVDRASICGLSQSSSLNQKIAHDAHGLSSYARVVATIAQTLATIDIETVLSGDGVRRGCIAKLILEIMTFVRIWEEQDALGDSVLVSVTEPYLVEVEIISKMTSVLEKVSSSEPMELRNEWLRRFASQLATGTQDGVETEGTLEREMYEVLSRAYNGANKMNPFLARKLDTVLRSIFTSLEISNDCLSAWRAVGPSLLGAGLYYTYMAILHSTQFAETKTEVDKVCMDMLIQKISALPKPNSDDEFNSAGITLQCLNYLLSVDRSGSPLVSDGIPQLQALLRTVRKWVDGTSGLRLEVPTFLLAQVMDFFRILVSASVVFDLNTATFVADLTKACLEEAKEGVDDLFTMEVIVLSEALLDISSSSPDIWAAVDKIVPVIEKSSAQIFTALDSRSSSDILWKSKREMDTRVLDLIRRIPLHVVGELCPEETLFSKLFSLSADVQLYTYDLLRKLTVKSLEKTSVELEMGRVDADTIRFPAGLMNGTASQPSVEISGRVSEKTFQLKMAYLSQLRGDDANVSKLFEYICATLGIGMKDQFDLKGWEFNNFEIEAFDLSAETAFKLFTAHIYWRLLRNAPGLVRSWWSENKNRQITLAMEKFTEKWYTPLLTREEIDAVLTTDFEDMTVKASKVSNEITAIFTIDEASIEFVVRFPSSYPLKQLDFDGNQGGRMAGIQDSRWRSWLRSTSIMAQNTTIVDALKSWRKSVSLHFEGNSLVFLVFLN